MKALDADATILARRAKIVAAMRRIVPGEGVIEQETGRRPYESDGLTAYRTLPMVVVLPDSVAQLRAVLAYCHENHVKVVPRGAGTSLSGGALPLADGVLLSGDYSPPGGRRPFWVQTATQHAVDCSRDVARISVSQ